MSEFKKTKGCEICRVLALCHKGIDPIKCKSVELKEVKLPIMPQGFKKRIMYIVKK